MAKMLCYELNEVPWRVVDRYVAQRPASHLALFLKNAAQMTSRTVDSGELHPWSTWPTMHRGVSNDVHNIRYINQDRSGASDYPPLWELLAASGVSVGLVGCLQSHPPVSSPNVLFHVPDTFAPGPETAPARYSAFQALNLKLTGENRAVAGRFGGSDLMNGLGLLRIGVSTATALRLSRHLLQERILPLHKSLRPTMQAHVAFDIFMDALRRSPPSYAAFFSNHVAGAMHRYWKYMFPEDFGYELSPSPHDRFHAKSIVRAMDIFDDQLGRLVRFAESRGYDVVVASSMGQEAIDRGQYIPELLIESVSTLSHKLGFGRPVRMNLAMQPDVALEFDQELDLREFVSLLPQLTFAEGRPIFKIPYAPQGLTLSLSMSESRSVLDDKAILCRGVRCSLEELGLRLISRDPGTGYHQPDGIVVWKGPNQPTAEHRQLIDSRRYAPMILAAMGVSPPPYMFSPVLGPSAERQDVEPHGREAVPV